MVFFLVQIKFFWFPRECSMVFSFHDGFITLLACNNIYNHPSNDPVPEHPLDHSLIYTETPTPKICHSALCLLLIVPQIKKNFPFLCLLQHSKSPSVQSKESTERALNVSMASTPLGYYNTIQLNQKLPSPVDLFWNRTWMEDLLLCPSPKAFPASVCLP